MTLAFRWHSNSHINVLELAALGALVRLIAIRYPDSRVVVLIDSQVAKHSAARGRSTSWALTPGLRRLAALALAFGLQLCFAFAPTRLNVADAPTRNSVLPRASGLALCESLPAAVLHRIGALRFRRPLASWARLFLVSRLKEGSCPRLAEWLAGHFAEHLPDKPGGYFREFDSTLGYPGEGPLCSVCPRPRRHHLPSGCPCFRAREASSASFGFLAFFSFCVPLKRASFFLPALCFAGLCFVLACLCTLNIPVYAPLPLPLQPILRSSSAQRVSACKCGSWTVPVERCFILSPLCTSSLPDSFPSPLRPPLPFDPTLGFPGEGWFRVFGVFWVLFRAMAVPAPSTPAEHLRAAKRGPLLLVADRVVRPATRTNRAKLLKAFDEWLGEVRGQCVESLIAPGTCSL